MLTTHENQTYLAFNTLSKSTSTLGDVVVLHSENWLTFQDIVGNLSIVWASTSNDEASIVHETSVGRFRLSTLIGALNTKVENILVEMKEDQKEIDEARAKTRTNLDKVQGVLDTL